VRWPLHLLRAGIGIVMLALFAYGVRDLSLAEAYTIFFIGPILITALSVFVLKERVNGARWAAIAIGMAGVLVVLRPTGEGVATAAGLSVLLAALSYSLAAITVRKLALRDSPEAMVFWFLALLAVFAGAVAAFDWRPVRGGDLGVIAGIGLTAAVLLFCFCASPSWGGRCGPRRSTARRRCRWA